MFTVVKLLWEWMRLLIEMTTNSMSHSVILMKRQSYAMLELIAHPRCGRRCFNSESEVRSTVANRDILQQILTFWAKYQIPFHQKAKVPIRLPEATMLRWSTALRQCGIMEVC